MLLSSLQFAAIGDYGNGFSAERDVANLVKNWNPALVVTLGDNNYMWGQSSTIDANIGQFYHQYMYPYHGRYGLGAPDHMNHFFPTPGNHDWYTSGAQPYFNYFTLPGNEHYYTFREGPVQFFAIDSDPHEPALGLTHLYLSTANSKEGQWLKSSLAASTAPWKIVFFHHPPYSSGAEQGSSIYMQWPFKEWGASAVLSGHEHQYERIIRDGLPYFVDGLGGASRHRPFQPTPVAGSEVRYTDDYGAMLIDATDTSITFKFITRTNKLIDTYSLQAPPAAPSQLTASGVSPTAISITWANNAVNQSGFMLERSIDGRNYAPAAILGATVRSFLDGQLSPNTRYYYRIKAINSGGSSAYAAAASATTFQAKTLHAPWFSASIGPAPYGGSVKIANDQYTVRGSGWDIGGTSDAFQLLGQKMGTHGDITVRLDSLQNTSVDAKGGIMIRAGLDPSAPFVGIFMTAGHTMLFETRTASGAETRTVIQTGMSYHSWMRLVRAGNTVSGYWSNDGLRWHALGWSVANLSGQAYVGMAVSSNNQRGANSAVFGWLGMTLPT